MSNNIYSNGDWVLQHPIAASVTFAGVLVVSAVLEFLIDNAAAVRNKYFRVMFNAINQEIMIVGVLILTMTFAQTLYDWPARWVLLFQWAMVALFFMTLLFVCLILGTLSAVTISTRLWLKFEVERMDTTDDLSSREHQYKAGFSKFQQALEAFGYDASMGIRFSKYIAKLQRRNIVALTDLTWVCWVCLATLVVLNTLRAEGTRQISQINDENIEDEMGTNQRLLNYGSFILFLGYGGLGLFLWVYWQLNRRLNSFLAGGGRRQDGPDTAAAVQVEAVTRESLEDPRSLLFRRSREATMELLQVLILCFEWYISVFFLSFAYEMVRSLGVATAVALMVAAVIPVVVFVVLLPWTLMLVTLLSALGNNLDEDAVQYLVIKAGVPESEWPPHMQRAVAKQARGGRSGDGGSARSGSTAVDRPVSDDGGRRPPRRGAPSAHSDL